MLHRTRLGLLAGRDRAKADREFYHCIKRHSRYSFLAGIRWFGVRIGVVGWLPFEKRRWGYGWEYPRKKAPKDDTSPYTAEEQRPVFEKLLREAQEQMLLWAARRSTLTPGR